MKSCIKLGARSTQVGFVVFLLLFTIPFPVLSKVIKLKPEQVYSVMGYEGDKINISIIVGGTGYIDGRDKYLLVPVGDCSFYLIVDSKIIIESQLNLNMNPDMNDISENAKFLTYGDINITGLVMNFSDVFKDEMKSENQETKSYAVVIDNIDNFRVLSLEKRLPEKMVTRLVFVKYYDAKIYDSPNLKAQKILKKAQIKVPLVVLNSIDNWFEVKEEFSYAEQKL